MCDTTPEIKAGTGNAHRRTKKANRSLGRRTCRIVTSRPLSRSGAGPRLPRHDVGFPMLRGLRSVGTTDDGSGESESAPDGILPFLLLQVLLRRGEMNSLRRLGRVKDCRG